MEEIALVQEIDAATKNTDAHQEPSKIIHRALIEGLYARKSRIAQSTRSSSRKSLRVE